MKYSSFRTCLWLGLLLCAAVLVACDRNDTSSSDDKEPVDEGETLAPFIQTDYIELAKIGWISRFRSGIGHSYTDDFETCRSMKHYYVFPDDVDAATIKLFSPIDGTIVSHKEGWAGTQVRIGSSKFPDLFIIVFHVAAFELDVGDDVQAGQQIGLHVGSQTWSDIALGYQTEAGWKLYSYFEFMTDELFARYQARGLLDRDDAIISPQARNDDPLICDGEQFFDEGNIENWVDLN